METAIYTGPKFLQIDEALLEAAGKSFWTYIYIFFFGRGGGGGKSFQIFFGVGEKSFLIFLVHSNCNYSPDV